MLSMLLLSFLSCGAIVGGLVLLAREVERDVMGATYRLHTARTMSDEIAHASEVGVDEDTARRLALDAARILRPL